MLPRTYWDWHAHHIAQARERFAKGMRASASRSLEQAALCRRILAGTSEWWL